LLPDSTTPSYLYAYIFIGIFWKEEKTGKPKVSRKSAANAPPLTDTKVRSLLRASQPCDVLDGATSGLYLRVGKRGATWSLLYRVNGHGGDSVTGHKIKGAMTRLHLGDYPTVSLASAREKAIFAHRAAEAGEDPRETPQLATAARGKSLAWLIEEYLEKFAAKSLVNAKTAGWVLKRHWTPSLGGRAFSSLKRTELNERLKEIAAAKDHGPGAAMDARRWIMSVYGWAIREEIAAHNPAVGLIGKEGLRQKPSDLRSRERVLTIEEARAVYRATFKMPAPWGELVRILLLTLARLGEFTQAERDWFDRSGRNFEVPGMGHKNKHPKSIPLTDLTFELIDQRPVGKDGPYLFSTTNGEKPIYSFADNYSNKLRQLTAAELGRAIPHFTLHDFRRSGSTHLTGLGVNEEVVETLLGHKIRGVRGIYMKHKFLEERRNALRLWEQKLTSTEKPAARKRR
jgi:integrase